MKKHNIIYQTTNLLNGKTYIGRHSTDNLDDGYLGSGTKLLEDIKRLGPDVFERIVLFDFDNPTEMIAKEIELLTEEFVSRLDTYNLANGQGGGYTHSEVAREKLRLINIGHTTVVDGDGNLLRVSVTDPRYLSGELKSNMHGMVTVKDKTGKKFRVKVDDPRYLSGELVAANKGHKHRPEKGQNHTKIMLEYWKEVGGHSDEAKEKCRAANVGRVTVRDNDGNTFRVPVGDPRYISGELINSFIGTKMPESARKKISEDKKNRIWIINEITGKSKMIQSEFAHEYISNGWLYGRSIPFKNSK